MSDGIFSRMVRMTGEDALVKLQGSHVTVVGLGGVGGICAEALARSGIGALTLIDGDRVADSNINRQIIALHSTIGRYKAEVMLERVLDINPGCRAVAVCEYFEPDNDIVPACDYVVDAIDRLKSKIALVLCCSEMGIPIVSSMGAGNKLNPGGFRVTDLFKTHTDPLAKHMRKELRGKIDALPVVWSPEEPLLPVSGDERSAVPGSIAFVPPAAGLVLAGAIVNAIIEDLR